MQALKGVKEAIKTKKIKRSVIEEKLERVKKCKQENLSSYTPIYIPSIANKVNSPATQTFLRDLKKKIEKISLEAKWIYFLIKSFFHAKRHSLLIYW